MSVPPAMVDVLRSVLTLQAVSPVAVELDTLIMKEAAMVYK